MTSKADAFPKLRVTSLICTDGLPQCAHRCSDDIDCNDDEFSGEADFDDGLRVASAERDAGYNVFDFTGFDITLALCDLPREDNVFEIKD